MKYLLKLAATVFALALAGGCANAPRKEGPDQINFVTAPESIMALANRTPVTLPLEFSDSDRARYLHGFPTVKDFPLGALPIPAISQTDERFLLKYREGEPKARGGHFTADDGIALGASMGGAAGGALAAASMFGPSAAELDVRFMASSALCYLPVEQASSGQEAIEKCALLVRQNFKTALTNSLEHNNPDTNYIVEGDLQVDGATKHALLIVFKEGAYYSTGFAPSDIGGFAAHIAFIRIKNFKPVKDNGVTVESVVQALKPSKPTNLAYLFSAAQDGRKRFGLDQIGVY